MSKFKPGDRVTAGPNRYAGVWQDLVVDRQEGSGVYVVNQHPDYAEGYFLEQDLSLIPDRVEELYAALRWVFVNGVKTDFERPSLINELFNEAYDEQREFFDWAPPARKQDSVARRAARRLRQTGLYTDSRLADELEQFNG